MFVTTRFESVHQHDAIKLSVTTATVDRQTHFESLHQHGALKLSVTTATVGWQTRFLLQHVLKVCTSMTHSSCQ
jgi:GTP cyclohydrolase FolE2